MKKNIKSIIIILLFCGLFLLTTQKVFATNVANLFQKEEYSEDFKKWLELSEEEKQNTMMPRMYDIENTKIVSKNPLYIARMLKTSINSKYSLRDVIPENTAIKNQQQTNSCWAFATLSSLETNLALSNYEKGINLSKIYDFSERHMEYATSKMFANNVENKGGYNRKVGSGGSYQFSTSYLTNGSGAIPELEMPFENNENTIDISQIQNKTVSSQVYDTVVFPDYRTATNEDKTEIMNQIKQHIQNYGSVQASIHGASSNLSAFNCYNNDTGGKFCNNSFGHSIDHAVSIIGWDDNYSIDNFSESAKPTSNGAWIVRNSWGEKAEEWNLSELKETIFNKYEQQCISNGWNSASEIPNENIEQAGYTIENDTAYIKYGDNGIIYISYEDVNVSKKMFGIVKATDTVNYDNIYQYDEYYPAGGISFYDSKVMLCNIFDKKTTGTEYLTQVSLYAPETYTCKVYVNPNGSSKAKEDLQLVSLKAGESETFNAGYHTLEFSKPIEINANSFAVVIEVQGTRSNRLNIPLESKVDGVEVFNSVKVESGKCFVATGNNLDNCQWFDLSKMTEQNPALVNGDSTIKAFTTTELLDESLKNIEIITPPTKTSYFEGENFDKTGMVVKAYYNSKTKPFDILNDSDYTITNGTNLQVGQTNVTITYGEQSVNQTISVEKNIVTDLKIITPPTKTEYKEGQSFDRTGMVIEATRKNGNKEKIEDYSIEDGNNLKVDQTKVIISYEGKKVEQEISVIPNPLQEIRIDKAPNKTDYIVGQNFDKTGMIITGICKDESTIEILDYTIENGTNLTKEQTSVTIKYLEKTVKQDITVSEKAITEITINKKPNKLKYIQNKENLDLSGGNILVTYNDGTTEIIEMDSEQINITGFNNKNAGKLIITLEYQSKTAELEIEIIEEEKAKNSDLEKAKSNIKRIKVHYSSKNSEEDYVTMEIEINNIERELSNDKVEYYYYLSTQKEEENITEWTKITEEQKDSNKLSFTINSKDILNYENISKENALYLYIKEVAIKGGNQSIKISKSISLENNTDMEFYVDNEKKENISNTDNTVATKELPNTGMKKAIIIITTFVILSIGIILYIKYKKLSKYVK